MTYNQRLSKFNDFSSKKNAHCYGNSMNDHLRTDADHKNMGNSKLVF